MVYTIINGPKHGQTYMTTVKDGTVIVMRRGGELRFDFPDADRTYRNRAFSQRYLVDDVFLYYLGEELT